MLFDSVYVSVVFVCCGIYILLAHHILPPTDTLACCERFPCQPSPQAAVLIGQQPYHSEKNSKRKKSMKTNKTVICAGIQASLGKTPNKMQCTDTKWLNGYLHKSILFYHLPLMLMHKFDLFYINPYLWLHNVIYCVHVCVRVCVCKSLTVHLKHPSFVH